MSWKKLEDMRIGSLEDLLEAISTEAEKVAEEVIETAADLDKATSEGPDSNYWPDDELTFAEHKKSNEVGKSLSEKMELLLHQTLDSLLDGTIVVENADELYTTVALVRDFEDHKKGK